MIRKNNLFHTPADWQELCGWLSNLRGSEAALATTAAMMAWNLAAKTQENVETVFALSTAHMPSSEPEFGELRAEEFEYGYVVWVADVDENYGIPEWLLPIMRMANKQENTLVLFDRDCTKHPELKTWDW